MQNDYSKIAESLHPLERRVLPYVSSNTFSELSQLSGISEAEISRPMQWLQEKGLVSIKESALESATLGRNGIAYAQTALPEIRFLKFLATPKTLGEIKEKSGLTDEEVNICLGLLRKKEMIDFQQGQISSRGKNGNLGEMQDFLSALPKPIASLSKEELSLLDELKRRKDIIQIETKKSYSAAITELGKRLQAYKFESIIDNLTPELLATSGWKDKKFRRYDLNIPVKQLFAGRRHYVREAIEYIRKIWLDMGFREMTGPMVQTSFWNFDALFTAQDHPVREMQDTFFVQNPKSGKLPSQKLVSLVRNMHEHGGGIGSKGWQYQWSESEARKNVLRTHTTCLSAQTIASLKLADLPAKFFSVGSNFRNETLDWSHLFELHQAEGIVIDENANMRHLIGYLKEFFRKMGFDKVRARPAYFPYTEPSMEIDVFHPVHKKWVELGGSGIFRPEVTVPLIGKDIPVLAWGLGVSRIIPDYYGITDIRDLFRNDLKQLREIKAWLK